MLAKMVHSQEPFPLRQWQKKPKPRNRYRIPVQNAVATHSTSVLQMSALPAVEPSTVVLLVLGAPETDSTLSSSTGGAGVKVSHIHSFSARKSSPTHKLHTAQQSWLCSSHGLLSHACTGTSSCSARLDVAEEMPGHAREIQRPMTQTRPVIPEKNSTRVDVVKPATKHTVTQPW